MTHTPRLRLLQLAACFAALQLVAAAAAGPPPPPPPPSILPHSLAETDPAAVCIDGQAATVYGNKSAGVSTTWVIQLGAGNGGAGLFCWMDPSGKPTGQLWDCSTKALPPKPSPAPPPPPRSYTLGAGGPQDTNCTRGPGELWSTGFCQALGGQRGGARTC